MRRSSDESGIILSWFLKIAVLLLVIGVVGYDVGSIVVNNVTLSSSAEDIAIAVSIDVDEQNITPSAFSDVQVVEMAKAEVADEENGVTSARVVQKGTHIDDEGVVHVRLRRKADTLITRWIGPLKKQTIAIVDGQAGT